MAPTIASAPSDVAVESIEPTALGIDFREQYELTEQLGAGGMGAVYRARDRKPGGGRGRREDPMTFGSSRRAGGRSAPRAWFGLVWLLAGLVWLLVAAGCNTYSDTCKTQRDQCLARCQKTGGYVTEMPQAPGTTLTGCERDCGSCRPGPPPAPQGPPTPTGSATSGAEAPGQLASANQ